ncbi:NAD(+) diphosphatase [Aggregatibacter sp. Marseille-P9115]|jgi:NAD+ diphosphatase|uniref:NAD(+) diphosphatase n=1 Tax=Aggregatibacter sp. Marseille-P9115 TaxID=2866570 RepID=UPI001E3F38CD|nr:NAD(+) diphosphatase [Aggregatibacter sp. Marseille-P9115]
MKLIQAEDKGFWLFTQGSTIHLVDGNLPFGSAAELGLTGHHALFLGEWSAQPLYLVEPQPNDACAYFSLRDQLSLPQEQFNLLARGVELNHFYQTHQFCGKCGGKTEQKSDEWAVQCQVCGFRTYPVICPCVIVAVRRGSQILLANHMRHKGGMYTTLAGFVEVGETFEEAVHREIWEETQIKVKNLRYVGNQPWAFPNSQMVGFLADYAAGEIHVQPEEIYDAQWFDCEQPLPELPPHGTIARKLIEATLVLCQQDKNKS